MIYGFQNKIRTQQNREGFGHLVEVAVWNLRKGAVNMRAAHFKSNMQIAHSMEHTVADWPENGANLFSLCIFPRTAPPESRLYFHKMKHKPFLSTHARIEAPFEEESFYSQM